MSSDGGGVESQQEVGSQCKSEWEESIRSRTQVSLMRNWVTVFTTEPQI